MAVNEAVLNAVAREARRSGCTWFAISWQRPVRDTSDRAIRYLRKRYARRPAASTLFRMFSNGDAVSWSAEEH